MSHAAADRRDFLRLSTKLAALGLAGLGSLQSRAFGMDVGSTITVTDYKALVCIFLFGGNDANNVIVPMDAAQNAQYKRLRGALALSGNSLLQPIADANGNQYALHYGLAEMNGVYGAGDLALVLNTGLLGKPLTRAEYLQGLNAPTNLFSHSDQIVQVQTGGPTPNGTGWGGRVLDRFGNADSLAALSMASPALFLQGFDVGGNAIPPGVPLGLSGMSFWPPSEATMRRQALQQMLGFSGGNTLRAQANKQFDDGLHLATTLQSAGALPGGGAGFPGTQLGNQLKEVARLIYTRAQQGPGRQVFFCALDGFDLHSGQDWMHWYLLSTLSQAVYAFYSTMGNAGLGNAVTTFTQSEFGRTMQPSGTGSDHAWGTHQLVIGGAVKGGVYGQLPAFVLGGPDDANNRGVWIPKISTAQFGATLGKWFGAPDADLGIAFPNLSQFSVSDIGFMG